MSPATLRGSACGSFGSCSASHQLCAALGGSQVKTKSGFKREERKVTELGLDHQRCHLPQHPPTAGPPASSNSGTPARENAAAPAERDFNLRQMKRNAEQGLPGYRSWDNSLPFLARNVNTNRVSYEPRRAPGICQLATSNFVRDAITDRPHWLPSASFALLPASWRVKIKAVFKNACIYLRVSSLLGISPKKPRAILPVPTLQIQRRAKVNKNPVQEECGHYNVEIPCHGPDTHLKLRPRSTQASLSCRMQKCFREGGLQHRN